MDYIYILHNKDALAEFQTEDWIFRFHTNLSVSEVKDTIKIAQERYTQDIQQGIETGSIDDYVYTALSQYGVIEEGTIINY